MSKAPDRTAAAALFFALGDPTRLSLVQKLGDGPALSATQLAHGSPVTRQAVTKHLRVLEDAGLVHHQKHGRDVLYVLDAARVDDARVFLETISARWDRAINRLRLLVEQD